MLNVSASNKLVAAKVNIENRPVYIICRLRIVNEKPSNFKKLSDNITLRVFYVLLECRSCFNLNCQISAIGEVLFQKYFPAEILLMLKTIALRTLQVDIQVVYGFPRPKTFFLTLVIQKLCAITVSFVFFPIGIFGITCRGGPLISVAIF